MLVLSRKMSEQIKIGDDITITVIRVAGNRVRLGVTAPAEIAVRRAELEGAFAIAARPPSSPRSADGPRPVTR
jgi:carbon storage regulator CsrA